MKPVHIAQASVLIAIFATASSSCLFPDYAANIPVPNDCAHIKDGSVHCAKAPPREWFGPALRLRGDELPSCPAGLVASGPRWSALNQTPASCATCSCSDPGITCDLEVGLFTALTMNKCANPCAHGPLTEIPAVEGNCAPFEGPNCGPQTYVGVNAKVGASKSCLQSKDGEDILPAPYSEVMVLCSPPDPGLGCASDEICATREAGCYFRTGEWPCFDPSLTGETIYAEINDDRRCTDCACAPTCSVSLHKNESSCMANDCDQPGPVVMNGACTYLPPSTDYSFKVCAVTTACQPVGGEATGQAALAGPITVCCP